MSDMEIPKTKRFIPKGFELGTTLSQPNRSIYYQFDGILTWKRGWSMAYWFGKEVAWAKDHRSTSFSWAAAQLFIHEWTKNNGVHAAIRRRNSLNILNKTTRKESRIRKTYCSIDVIYFLRIDWGHWGESVRKNLSVFAIRRLCKKIGQSLKESLRGGKLVQDLKIFWMNNKTVIELL